MLGYNKKSFESTPYIPNSIGEKTDEELGPLSAADSELKAARKRTASDGWLKNAKFTFLITLTAGKIAERTRQNAEN